MDGSRARLGGAGAFGIGGTVATWRDEDEGSRARLRGAGTFRIGGTVFWRETRAWLEAEDTVESWDWATESSGEATLILAGTKAWPGRQRDRWSPSGGEESSEGDEARSWGMGRGDVTA